MTDDRTTDEDAVEGKVAPPFRTAEMAAIESQLAATRLQLAGTIDELTERLSPRNLAQRAQAGARGLVHDAVSSDADPQARRNARIVLGVVVAVVAVCVTGAVRSRG